MLVNREPRGPEPAKGRMTAATACRTCAIEPREGARFCDGCGAPVTANDTRAEYKQVTVLFADVVHSMDIAAVSGINAPRSGDLARAVGGVGDSLVLARRPVPTILYAGPRTPL